MLSSSSSFHLHCKRGGISSPLGTGCDTGLGGPAELLTRELAESPAERIQPTYAIDTLSPSKHCG